MSKHTVVASGFVGRDAECKYTPSGVAVMNFSLAVDTGYGENHDRVCIDCCIEDNEDRFFARLGR